MESNPYAPPKALVRDREPDTHGLKYRSLWLMVVFFVVTFGLYSVIWFFRRRPGLNRLDSPLKLPLWPLVVAAASFALEFALGLVAGDEPVSVVIGEGGVIVLTLVRLLVGIVMIIQSFRVRDIIQDHATPQPEPDQRFVDRVQLSGVMTFFLSVFYLQWAINRYIVGGATQ